MEGLSINSAALLANWCAALLTWGWRDQISTLVNLIKQALYPLWDDWSFDVFSAWLLRAFILIKSHFENCEHL